MKRYKLKQWYPSLPKSWTVGDIVSTWRIGSEYYHVPPDRNETIYKEEVENNPDFWELIEEKKPLFITDDGVEVFDRNTIVYNVRNNTLEKIKIHSIHLNEYDFEHKVFSHESNADEYILWNKPLLSLHDIDSTIELYSEEFDKLKQLAKEGIDNGK